MAFSYTAAPIVKVGDTITSMQAASFAAAFNDRLRLGHGPSCAWRIMFYLLSAFRQIRNPDASGLLFPRQDEFFTTYQPILSALAQWPDAGPGDPEGCNLESQMPLFVFGLDPLLAAEGDRLTDPGQGGLNLNPGDGSPRALWALMKTWRGGWDPASGGFGSPALYAAQSHTQVRYQAFSPYGMDWGDYLAGPVSSGPCADGTPDLQFIFTKTDGSHTSQTWGRCAENPGDAAAILQTPWSWVVIQNNGVVVTLPIPLWQAGPYTTNPTLRKQPNQFIERALNRYVGDFRGTPAQIQSDGINADAFDFQTFFASQYLLAPQRGASRPNAGGQAVLPDYMRFTLPAGAIQEPGTALLGQTQAAGVVTQIYVEAANLAAPTAVTLLRDGQAVATATLSEQKDGSWQGTAMIAPESQAGGGLWTCQLAQPAVFTGAGTLWAEITDLMPWHPSVPDAYLILRLGAIDAYSETTDGSGLTTMQAAQIWQKYITTGAPLPQADVVALPGSAQAINTNGVFDAARRLSQCIRWIPRSNLIGMAVTGGKTVLWFQRYASGLAGQVQADLFTGLGPAPKPIPSGAIRWGRTYVVRGTGQVTYGQRPYAVGGTFTGQQGVAQFTADAGATVYELEGIRQSEPQGFDNRWILGVDLRAYRDNDASIWKPAAYGDYFPTINRCLLCDPVVASDPILSQHMAYGNVAGGLVLSPEAPPYANYVPGTDAAGHPSRANEIACADGDATCAAARAAFYSSCPVEIPWPDVESVQADLSMGPGVVRVTLASRLQYDPVNAPASFTNAIASWDQTALANEPYCTWENAIRRYLIWASSGANFGVKIGDQAFSQGCTTLLDAPWGSILPTFHFLKLVPTPYNDGTGQPAPSNTATWHDMMGQAELYLRAICSGYVDGQTTAALACSSDTTGWFNFTFENLIAQTSQGQWISPIAWATTTSLDSTQVAASRPQGYGPLPNTIMSAQVFNAMSAAVNALTTFQVIIPATLQVRTATNSVSVPITPMNAAGAPTPPASSDIGEAPYPAVWYQGGFPAAPAGAWGAWTDEDGTFPLSATLEWLINQGAGPTGWVATTQRTDTQYQWAPQPDAEKALPPDWADMLTLHPAFFGQIGTASSWQVLTIVSGAGSGSQCSPGGGSDTIWSRATSPATAIEWGEGNLSNVICGVLTGGQLAPPPLPATPTWYAGSTDGHSTCLGVTESDVEVYPANWTGPAIMVPLSSAPVAPNA